MGGETALDCLENGDVGEAKALFPSAEVLSKYRQDALAGEHEYDNGLEPSVAVVGEMGAGGGEEGESTGIDNDATGSLDDGRLHLTPGQVKKKIRVLQAFEKKKFARETKHLTSCGVQLSSLRPTLPIMTFASSPTGRLPKKVVMPRVGGRGAIAVDQTAAKADAEAEGLSASTEEPVTAVIDQSPVPHAAAVRSSSTASGGDEMRVRRLEDHLLKVQDGQRRAIETARAAAARTASLSLAAQRLHPSVTNAPVRVLRGWTRERRFLIDYSAPPAGIPAAAAPATPGLSNTSPDGATARAATAATTAAIAVLRGERQPQPPQVRAARPGRPKPPHQFGCRAAGGHGAHVRLVGFRELRDQLPTGMPNDRGGVATAAASDQVEGEALTS